MRVVESHNLSIPKLLQVAHTRGYRCVLSGRSICAAVRYLIVLRFGSRLAPGVRLQLGSGGVNT